MQSKNKYALKIVSKSTLVKPRAEQKLRSEIRIHRTLNHENIVRFERYFEDNHNAYLLLELCINNSMSDLMKRRKKLVEFEARYYLSQIVHSLKYLHNHKVIHRDLKLGNLFIDHHMRVKVGDFGLATKLSYKEERKKTVCGTPNYIAPEILEGKNGHSFEVDIWSTGVILFTLLCGKPPFEAKDVKSTYKRIVANQYTFPDHTVVSTEAKDLIRYMLQPKPHNRPSLDECIQHEFFTGPQAYCPTKLEESCLKEAPTAPAKTIGGSGNSAFAFGAPRINDENDPLAANRGTNPGEPLLNLKVGGGPPRLGERAPSTSGRAAAAAPKAAFGSSTRAPVSTNPGMSGDLMPRRSSSGSSGNPNRGGSYSQKFEIYQDGVGKKSGSGSGIVAGSSAKATSRDSFASVRASGTTTREEITSSGYLSTLGSGKSTKSSSSVQANDQESAKTSKIHQQDDAMDVVESLNVNMEQVQISAGATVNKNVGAASATASAWAGPSNYNTVSATATASASASASASTSARASTPKSSNPTVNPSKPLDTLESMHKMLNRGLHDNEAAGVTGNGYMAAHAQASNNHLDSPEQKAVADTSYDQDGNGVGSRPGTSSSSGSELRSAHLTSARSSTATSHTETEDLQTIFTHGQPGVRSAGVSTRDLSRMTAKVWVVRYVDYTSKYGLGFLLNTGSAGVYFNDSTKIVLSADGTLFQYVERRRRENGHSSSEHMSQTHLMGAYPQELQKKVTLLRHFRNYLVDQQRAYSGTDEGGNETETTPNMPAVLPESSNSGATSTIKFGVSSCHFDSKNAVEMGITKSEEGEGVVSPLVTSGSEHTSKDGEMPFLKKWVRTRHAILFRLSNRVVQVVFFDRSEVLLSPEARVVTYVNKSGSREEHSLEEVLHSGRSDIAKRLKYTKDIIWRLINVNGAK
jgi:serine/threonine protein kinase